MSINFSEGRGEYGLAIILAQETAKRVLNIEQKYWDGLIKIEKVYKIIEVKWHLIAMGDWNAVVREEISGILIDKYGLGRKNKMG